MVDEDDVRLFSHSSGGQKTQIEVLAGLSEASVPGLSQLLVAAGVALWPCHFSL